MSARSGWTRRAVLGTGLGLVGSGLLAGCTASDPDEPPAPTTTPTSTPTPTPEQPTPDALARDRAATATLALLALTERLTVAGPAPLALRDRLVAVHRAHLTALGGPPTGSDSSSTGTTPTGTTPTGALTGPVTPAQLVAAETAAAQAAFDDVLLTSPGLATLLARVAAARALDAVLLARTAGLDAPAAPAPPPGAPAASSPLPAGFRTALARRLAGAHAAVYAYAVVRAQLTGAPAQRAARLWALHVRRRDALERRLIADGVEPPAAEPAYALGTVRAAEQAAGLAARVERGLARLAAAEVGTLDGIYRHSGAGELVAAAQRIAEWTGRPEELPG